MSIDAMKQVLEVMDTVAPSVEASAPRYYAAREALRAAIEQVQPEQNPLTEKRIEELYSFWIVDCQDIVGFARAIERSKPQMQPCAGRNCGSTNPNLHSAECFEDYEKSTGMAQPEQEPSIRWDASAPVLLNGGRITQYPNGDIGVVTPAPRQWQGLTDEEIIDVLHPLVMADLSDEATDYEIARAIEAKLKEKNT